MDTKIIDNRYEVKEQIGHGLWGEVFKVIDLSNHQTKALKTITGIISFSQKHQQLLKGEFHRLVKLRHPHIISVYDFGFTINNIPYYTMEYMKGGSLSFSNHPLKETLLHEILSQLILGLQFIHSKGYIHGDLKHENVLNSVKTFSSSNESNFTLKISDFSLSDFNQKSNENNSEINTDIETSYFETSLLKSPSLKGSLPFIAPEKFFNKQVDYRADLYSLGVLIYQLATGVYPFSGQKFSEFINNVLQKHPVPPSRFNAKLSEKFEFIILHLLEKEPLKRFQSAQEVLNTLGQIASSPGKKYLISSKDSFVIGTKFISRESELSTARDLLEQVREATGQVLFVYGEAGIGKTRFIEELKVIAQLQNFKVAKTACSNNGETFIEPLIEILYQLGLPQQISDLELPSATLHRLQNFITIEQRNKKDTNKDELIDEQKSYNEIQLLYEAIFLFLEAITMNSRPELTKQDGSEAEIEQKPLLIIIENLHQAHQHIIEFCRYINRNIPSLPILFCLTYRDDEIVFNQSEEKNSLFSMHQESRLLDYVHSIRLSRFQIEELSKFVTNFLEISTIPAGFVKKIHQVTGGNPLHIDEILRYLLEHKVLSFEQGNWWISDKDAFENIPAELRKVYEIRYNYLTELQRQILQIISVKEEKILFVDLVNISEKDTFVLSDLLEELVSGKLLNREILNNEIYFSFCHASFQKFVLGTLQNVKKAEIHKKIGEILEIAYHEGKFELAGKLSFHYQYGGNLEKAYFYAKIAADIAKQRMEYAQEAFFLDLSLKLLPEKIKKDEQFQLFFRYGRVLLYLSDYKKAVKIFEKAASLINKKENKKQWGILQSKIGYALEASAEWQNAKEIYLKALSIFSKEELDRGDSIQILLRLSWVHNELKEFRQAVSVSNKVLKLARENDDKLMSARALNHLGHTMISQNKYDRAKNYFNKSVKLYYEVGYDAGLCYAYNNLGILHDRIGNWEKAIEFHKKSLAISKKIGDLSGEARSLSHIATAFAMRGDLENTLHNFQKALEIYNKLGVVVGQAITQHNIGELYLRRGNFKEAHYHFMKSIEIKERINDESAIALTYQSLAELAIRQEELESAHDYILKTQKTFKKLNLKTPLMRSYRLLATVYVKQENYSYAIREINRAIKLSSKLNDKIELGNIHTVHGEIFEKMGDSKKAIDSYMISLEIFKQTGAEFELASVYLKIGSYHLHENNLREAGLMLDNAHKLFEKLKTTDLLQKTENLKHELNAKLQPLYFSLPSDSEQLRSLIRISHLLNSIKDVDRLLEEILDIIIKTLNADRGAIFLKDMDSGKLYPEIIRNLEKETLLDAEQLSQTIIQNVVIRGEPVYITDTKLDSLTSNSKSIVLYGIVAVLCIPLKVYDTIIGVVYLDSRSIAEIFLEHDLLFVAAFANMAALSISNGLERKKIIHENNYYKIQQNDMFALDNLIAISKSMRSIFKLIAKIAHSASNVLISGESGTGKELIARAIHNLGGRQKDKYFAFFCGNLPETIIDSELFGYVKGAFTGAVVNKKGIFEEANNGTVLLDEISEISPQIQTKLLRFLQERELKPLGANYVKKVDVRILAATNKNLMQEVKKGNFREDLYYRLKVIEIPLPPLRERREDIPALTHHFLRKYTKKLNKSVKGISKSAMERLTDYSWPGNIRELENQIELAVNLVDEGDVIDINLLSDDIRNIENIVKGIKLSGSLKDVLSHVEREIISNALLDAKGNKTKAARKLGISRQSLNMKLKALKIF